MTKFRTHGGEPLELLLYKYDACFFCGYVQRGLDRLGMTLPSRDTLEDAGAYEELVAAGGKSQVPALSINGKIMYESRDIVEFLEHEVIVADATP